MGSCRQNHVDSEDVHGQNRINDLVTTKSMSSQKRWHYQVNGPLLTQPSDPSAESLNFF